MSKFFNFKQKPLWPLMILLILTLNGCGKSCQKDKEPTSPESQGKVVDLTELKYMPEAMDVLLSINWKELSASPLGAKIKENMPPDVLAYVNGMEFFMLGLGGFDLKNEPTDLLVIIRSTMDSDQVKKLIKEEEQNSQYNRTASNYKGVTLYKASSPTEPSLAYFEDTLFVGYEDTLKKAIDLKEGQGKSMVENKTMNDQMRKIDISKTLWAVGIMPPSENPLNAKSNSPMPSNFESLLLTGDFSKGLQLDAKISFGKAEEAKNVENMLNMYKGILGTQNEKMGLVFNNFSFKVEDKELSAELQLDEASLEKLTQEDQPASGSSEDQQEAKEKPAN